MARHQYQLEMNCASPALFDWGNKMKKLFLVSLACLVLTLALSVQGFGVSNIVQSITYSPQLNAFVALIKGDSSRFIASAKGVTDGTAATQGMVGEIKKVTLSAVTATYPSGGPTNCASAASVSLSAGQWFITADGALYTSAGSAGISSGYARLYNQTGTVSVQEQFLITQKSFTPAADDNTYGGFSVSAPVNLAVTSTISIDVCVTSASGNPAGAQTISRAGSFLYAIRQR